MASRDTQAAPAHVCGVCGATLRSRNQLFAHLRQSCSEVPRAPSPTERTLLQFGYLGDAYPAGLQACGVPGSVEAQLWEVRRPSPFAGR
jgi:hypothetical protein